jgi:acetate kinase
MSGSPSELILVINAGSSSLKFSIYSVAPTLRPLFRGEVEEIGSDARLEIKDDTGKTMAKQATQAPDAEGALDLILNWLKEHLPPRREIGFVGHRVVHGGPTFLHPVLVDDRVVSRLEALVPWAPLHQPHNLAAIRIVRKKLPGALQVACFDTSFHASQPPVATHFALPRTLTDKGIRRYGFHGLSYEYIVSTLPQLTLDPARRRFVIAHLGSGASMCAVKNGRSVATTMSFTPVDGLPMGTRCGALDPGVILYLLQHERFDARAIQDLIYHKSGLLGVSGIASDMRTLEKSKLPAAREAIDLFVYRIGRELGSLVAALGGLDGLIFTGGIGEKAAPIRARVCADASWLGIEVDAAANDRHGPELSSLSSRVPVWIVPTDENLTIARHTQHLLQETSHA